MKKNIVEDWLATEIREVALRHDKKWRPPESIETIYRQRLLKDQRINRTWVRFTKFEKPSVRKKKIERFIRQAPILLHEGTKLHIANVNMVLVENLKDFARAVEHLRKRIRPLRQNYPSNLLDELLANLGKSERWAEKKKERLHIGVTDISIILFGEEFERLAYLKKQTAKKFDETYSFNGIAILLKMIFGQTFHADVGEIVMAMKGVPETDYEVDVVKSRVAKAVRNLEKAPPDKPRKVEHLFRNSRNVPYT